MKSEQEDKLHFIQQLESAAQEMNQLASSMRQELAADGEDLEIIKKAIAEAGWDFTESALARIAGDPKQQRNTLDATAIFHENSEITAAVKRYLSHTWGVEAPKCHGCLPGFAAPRVLVSGDGNSIIMSPLTLRLRFESVEEIHDAIRTGVIKGDALYSQLNLEGLRIPKQIEAAEKQLERLRQLERSIRDELSELKRLPARRLPGESYAQAFERRWGELARYNGDLAKQQYTADSDYQARMRAQQQEYDRLLKNDLDFITEEPKTSGDTAPNSTARPTHVNEKS